MEAGFPLFLAFLYWVQGEKGCGCDEEGGMVDGRLRGGSLVQLVLPRVCQD